MLADVRPDIVVIAAPPRLHHAIALAALSGGAHVLCEKPLAMSAAEARSMVEAARQHRRVGMTCFNWRFPAAMQRMRDMIEAGHVGRPFHVDGRWLGARWADETAASTWRMDRSQAGHGAMGDMGVHLIDLVRWNFGEFTRVVADAGVAYPSRTVPGGDRPADAEDFCALLAELDSGARVQLTVSRAARGANEQALEAFGSAGALAYRLTREGARWYRGELRASNGAGLAPVRIAGGVPRSATDGDQLEVTGKTTIGPLVRRFLAAIDKGEGASPSFEDGLRAQEVLDAVLESISSGGWARVTRAAAQDPGA
jgi:predicted dehydrogenase